MDKMEQARREGMSYALRIAKEKGIDGLEEELKFRNCTGIPLVIPRNKLNEAVDNIKKNTLDTVMVLTAVTLRDEFDFGEKRLARFVERFNSKAELLESDYATWDDMLEILAEEANMKLEIRHNEKNVIIKGRMGNW